MFHHWSLWIILDRHESSSYIITIIIYGEWYKTTLRRIFWKFQVNIFIFDQLMGICDLCPKFSILGPVCLEPFSALLGPFYISICTKSTQIIIKLENLAYWGHNQLITLILAIPSMEPLMSISQPNHLLF